MLLGTTLVKLLEATPVLRGKITGDFSAQLFGLALLVSLALGLAGGLYPAYRGSRMLPAQALRHE
jgi:putative ABC transport system permease protein